MQSLKTTQSSSQLYCHSPLLPRGDETIQNLSHFLDLGELQKHDAVDLSSSYSRCCVFNEKSNNVAVVNNNLQYGTFNMNLGSAEVALTSAGCTETGKLRMFQNIENCGDSGMEVNNQQIDDASTDTDTDDKNQCNRVAYEAPVVVDSQDQSKVNGEDQKTLRRLAQNRETARKSRLRKKAYVQQLENSKHRLAQLEQELQQARQQGVFIATGTTGNHGRSVAGNGELAFDMDYAHWVDEHQRLINGLRSAVNSGMGDNELHLHVDAVMAHYEELFRLKSIGAKADVFHMLSGMWKTPAERCFMWLGGFRSSELLKIVRNQLEPLTDLQLMSIYNLQQCSQQAEDALSQGMEALQQSLLETLSSTSMGPTGSGNVAEYMGQMAIAMGKLATVENFLHQADLLREQTLQQLKRILTTLQAAHALLAINDYISRLRTVSSLWLACPKE